MSPIAEKWGNFIFKHIEKNEEENVIDFLGRYFYAEEAIGRLLGCAEDYARDMDQNYRWIFSLGQNLSFMAVDENTGEIAGVQIIFEKSDALDYTSLWKKHRSESMEILRRIVTLAETPAPNEGESGRLAKIVSSSVAPKFCGQGLATEMYRRSIELLKARGITSVYSNFTHPKTRTIGTKFGFREKNRVVFSELDFRWKKTGERVFLTASPTEFLSVQILYL